MRHGCDTQLVPFGSGKPTCTSPPHLQVQASGVSVSRQSTHELASVRSDLDTNQTQEVRRPKTPSRPDGFVYFVSVDGGPIKIGWTGDLDRRIAGLQTAHWNLIGLIAVLPGRPSRERKIHRELAAHRIRGEWFEADAVLDYLKQFEAVEDYEVLA